MFNPSLEAPAAPSPMAVARFLVGIVGATASLTLLWLSMRAVMEIGGACASGGPYVPAVVCPDAVVALTPLSIFGLFGFGALVAWGGYSIPGPWGHLIFLGWPALFLSLGWNFLEFGWSPPGSGPGEHSISWLFCGVVFVIMGGGPLLVGLQGAAHAGSGGRAYAGGRVVVAPRRPRSQDWTAASRAGRTGTSAPTADRLERLARLHAAGDLTDAEFEAAKWATLEEDR